MTVFAHFPLDTSYFGEVGQQAMVNFRADDLDQLLVQLGAAGVRIDPKREGSDYGCIDLEGNQAELWEEPKAK
jgi:hypothetical protein